MTQPEILVINLNRTNRVSQKITCRVDYHQKLELNQNTTTPCTYHLQAVVLEHDNQRNNSLIHLKFANIIYF